MDRRWWARFLVFIAVVGISVFMLVPTFFKIDPEHSKYPYTQKINLGLDLQGGLYMVLGINFNQLFKEVVERQGMALEGRLKSKGIPFQSQKLVREGYPIDDPRVHLTFDPSKREEIYNLIKAEFWSLRLAGEKPGFLELGLSTEYRADVRDRTLNQSIGVIRNRIDEFGVTEPTIASQGNDRVVVELPGVKEVDRAKDLIGRTAKLEFRIVADKAMPAEQVAKLVSDVEKEKNLTFKEGQKFSEFTKQVNEALQGKIPPSTEVAFEKVSRMNPNEPGASALIPYLLYSKTELTGDELADAQVAFDQQTNMPHVSFTMNPRGAVAFEELTGKNIGQKLAIVLDGIVHSAPVIQSKIGERGQISLGNRSRDDVMKEAKDLAIVLRAGALPAQLDFLEQRVVGPSLGSDSVKQGALASVIGIILVFLFTLIYYRVSGVIAVISLFANVLLVLAVLLMLDATLTLPGIAGIGLTVGIAVDSNVVIYERIREELRAGKGIAAAVEAGFQKAFRTILDANVTNAAGALVLLNYGTGPVKGFAVTMLIGIVSTLFTAVFVCRVLFDAYLERLTSRRVTKLSI